MRKVWLIQCTNEYHTSVELLCESEELANELRDLMQAAADDGTNPLQETFYGTFTVEERLVADTVEDVQEAWNLDPCDFSSHWHEGMAELPDWKRRLDPFLGEHEKADAQVIPLPVSFPKSLGTNPEVLEQFEAYLKIVYAEWYEYPDCRFHIPGEGMWGKVLPDFEGTKLVGLNSAPIDGSFMTYDIHVAAESGNYYSSSRVHRRFYQKVYFRYQKAEDDDADKQIRAAIRDRLAESLDIGNYDLGYFCPGVGYVLSPVEDWRQAGEEVDAALGDVAQVPWDDEGDDDGEE